MKTTRDFDSKKGIGKEVFEGSYNGKKVKLVITRNHGKLSSNIEYFTDGQLVYKRKLTALVGYSKLFDNKLIVDTGRSEGKDSNHTIFIDLDTGKDIFYTATKVSRRGHFLYENGVLKVETAYGIFEIDAEGGYRDKLDYLKTAVASNEFIYPDLLKELIDIQEKTKSNLSYYHKIADEYPDRVSDQYHYLSFVSAMLRLDAELYEDEKNYRKAYEKYILGLKIEPKLGVKRAVTRLRKYLNDEELQLIESQTDILAQRYVEIQERNRIENHTQ